jgi:predicted  nucleic acid-binding Zn-ribbon protein
VQKEERLSELRSDLKKLEQDDGKILRNLTKERATVEKVDIELSTEESTLRNMKEQLKTKQTTLDSMNQ